MRVSEERPVDPNGRAVLIERRRVFYSLEEVRAQRVKGATLEDVSL